MRRPSLSLVPDGEELRQVLGVALDDGGGLSEIAVARGIVPMAGDVFQRTGHFAEAERRVWTTSAPVMAKASPGGEENSKSGGHTSRHRNCFTESPRPSKSFGTAAARHLGPPRGLTGS